ncbi:type II toxin-antitoxin system RelE/ParE family toxin [Pseudomonas knackmussii]|uniref:type II toxin-antitoxin system RelE/ParE family toxin n=1 Tax=Pseudomonas knackmussii TaxID=65741 RepID=UPI003BBC6462
MKGRPVIPRAVARQDIESAVEHYLNEDTEKAALGLIDELEKVFGLLARHPESGSSRYAHELDLPGLRSWPLKRYPYLIFYVVRADHIDVWRVLHAMQDIPAWMTEGD